MRQHIPHALWLIMDLVEAAVRTGRHAEAASHVAAAGEAGIAGISPRLAMITHGPAAMATPDQTHGDLFETALAAHWSGQRAGAIVGPDAQFDAIMAELSEIKRMLRKLLHG